MEFLNVETLMDFWKTSGEISMQFWKKSLGYFLEGNILKEIHVISEQIRWRISQEFYWTMHRGTLEKKNHGEPMEWLQKYPKYFLQQSPEEFLKKFVEVYV